MIKNLTDNKKTNIQIHIKSVEEILKDLPPSDALKVLEKLAMKKRKANGLRISDVVIKTRNKYPQK